MSTTYTAQLVISEKASMVSEYDDEENDYWWYYLPKNGRMELSTGHHL